MQDTGPRAWTGFSRSRAGPQQQPQPPTPLAYIYGSVDLSPLLQEMKVQVTRSSLRRCWDRRQEPESSKPCQRQRKGELVTLAALCSRAPAGSPRWCIAQESGRDGSSQGMAVVQQQQLCLAAGLG